MKTRTCVSLFLFFAVPASAAMIGNRDAAILPIIVKAQKPVRSISSGPKTIITRQQISISGAATLAQALQNLGGVQLQDMSGNGSQVLLSMRGFGANAGSNTLLLVNGIPITNPDMAPPDLNAIPLQAIEYIEIIAGSESVLYGDQAVGGIINIVTREQVKEKVALVCGTGSYHQYHCYVTLQNHYQQLKYNATLAKNHSANYRNHNDYDQNLLLGNIGYHYSIGSIKFDYTIASEFMQYPGALTAEQVRQNRRQASNSTDFFSDWNGVFHLRQEQMLTPDWKLQTDIARRDTHGHGVLMTPFTQSRMTNFIKPQIKGTLGNTLVISGVDLQNDNYRLQSTFGTTADKQEKYGVFALAKIPMNSVLAFSIGARDAQQDSHLTSFTTNDTINRALATTLGGTWQLTPALELYLRRAGSFRFPKADEDASTPPGSNGLRTQRGVAYETGVESNQEKYSGKIGIYQLNLRDEIAFDPTQTPEAPFGLNRNLDPTVRRGLTLSGKNHLTSQITLDGQYNFVSARFQSGIYAGNRIPLVSENIFRAGVNYLLHEHWNLYTEAVFTGNQYADNDNANIAGKIGGYTTYNFNVGYEYKQFSADLRLNNIFNKYYYFYTVYQSTLNNEFFYPAAGRNITMTINYSFV